MCRKPLLQLWGVSIEKILFNRKEDEQPPPTTEVMGLQLFKKNMTYEERYEMRVREAIKEAANDLQDKEFSFVEFDNAMMSYGFYTKFGNGIDFDELAESGVTIYYLVPTYEEEEDLGNTCYTGAYIEFEVVRMMNEEEDERDCDTVIKISNISEG